MRRTTTRISQEDAHHHRPRPRPPAGERHRQVSGTLTHFIAESAPNETEYEGIEDSRPVSFFSAGLSGRFDIGGRRVQKGKTVANNER